MGAGDRCDVAVVGGGGIGSAVAYFLTRLDPGIRVRVYERDPTYARSSTALAAGGVRLMFSTPENVLMSRFGVEFFQRAADELAVDGPAPDVAYRPHPYLRLLDESAREAVRAQVAMQRELGASPQWLERDALAARFPWMRLDGVAFGVLGGGGEGVFDPYALLQALRRKAIAQGAEYVAAAVAGFERGPGGAIGAVVLETGERHACGRVVDAAGPAAGAVAAWAGLELPVAAMKALTFAFRVQRPVADCPTVLDHVTGLNFKPEGRLFLAGWPGGEDPADPGDFAVDHAVFEAEVWPRLAERAGAFEAVRVAGAWAGHMELNRFDGNPVLGPHPDCPGFVFAAGFSGHGAQHIPAAGRAIAEIILHGRCRTLDLSRFGYERLVSGARLPEAV